MACRWSDTEWENRVTAVFTAYSGVGQGPGNSGSGDTDAPGKFGTVPDHPVIQQLLPLSDHFTGAAFDAVICFPVAELG